MPAIGSTDVIAPFSRVKPVGVFIHAFTITTKTADAAPLAATITPATRWARGGIFSQP